MSCPRIEVDLGKISENTQIVARRLNARGIGVTGVTKAVCGHPAIAQAMLEGGAVGLGDARISNIQKLRRAGVTCPVTLIRTPMLSQVDQVVQYCEASYNTELVIIEALAAAAIRNDTVHGIILMVEMGDRREGILPENLAAMAQQVVHMPGVNLKGIGANFACLGHVAPDAAQMATLGNLANEVEARFGPYIETLSGGNSANLPWALSEQSAGRINDLRLGEAILLGVDPVSGKQIAEMHTNAFALIAEVIETDANPIHSPIKLVDSELAKLRVVSNSDNIKRLILAIGRQDTDVMGLSMPAGSTMIGATSDHLVIETKQSRPKVGSEMSFQMNYSALMHAMAAPDIETIMLHDQRSRGSRRAQNTAEHLVLV